MKQLLKQRKIISSMSLENPLNIRLDRPGFLVLILGLSLILLSTLLYSPAVSAAKKFTGEDFNASALNTQVLDHQLYYFAASCFALHDMDQVTVEGGTNEIDSWDWFKGRVDPPSARGGMYKNFFAKCEGNSLKEAFDRFDLKKTPLQIFCSLDFTYNRKTGGLGKGDTSRDCELGVNQDDFDGNGSQSDQLAAFEKVASSTPRGKAAKDNLSNEAEYIRYFRTFTNMCGAQAIEPYKGGAANNNTAYKVARVDKNGTVEEWLYTSRVTDGTKVPLVATRATSMGAVIFASADNKAARWISCGELAVALHADSKYVKAYSAYVTKNKPKGTSSDDNKGGSDSEGGGDSESNSCAVEGVGWIVCPLLSFMATINEKAFDFIAGQLEIKPEFLSNTSDTQAAWNSFRDIANIVFVIAFLFIVYSQMTGAGITNYGLKKLLPKLIIAAILVNVSYILCQIAVDISNIIGNSIFSFFKDVSISSTAANSGAPRGWKDVMAAILIIGLAAAALIAAASTLGIAALLAFMMIIIILVARKALLILLVVISPLAFVAYLLPNTEQWFKKWWKLFSSLLMLFPVISVVFGASYLASHVVGNAQGSEGDGEGALTIQLTALAIMTVPLFAVPMALKGAMAATGALGSKLSGGLDRATKATGGNIKRGRSGEFLTAQAARRQNRKLKRRVGNGRFMGVVPAGRINKAIDQSKFGRMIGGDRGAAAATSAVHHEFDEEVKRQKSVLSGRSNDSLLRDLEDGKGSEEYQSAIAGTIMSRNHRASHLKALEIVRNRNQQAEKDEDSGAMGVTSSIQKQMAADMKEKPWGLGDQASGQLVEGTFGRSKSESGETGEEHPHFTNSIESQLLARVGTKLSAQSLATMNPDEMKIINKAATDGTLGEKELTQLKSAISNIRSNPQMNALVKPEAREQFDKILPPTPPAPEGQADWRGGGYM